METEKEELYDFEIEDLIGDDFLIATHAAEIAEK